MIVFLTLLYVGLLAILVKFGVIRLNLWWKLSPLIWMLALFVVLFVPLQWGAPSGPAQVAAYVVEVVPNVTGEVTEVVAVGGQDYKKGDLLFQIDPRPFQTEVDRLEAAPKEAEQAAAALPADLASATAAVAQAEAALVDARQSAESLGAALDGARAAVVKAEAQLALAKATNDRNQELLKQNAVSQDEAQTTERNLKAAQATLDVALAAEKQAQLAYDAQIDGVNTGIRRAEEAVAMARAAEAKAQLAVDSTVNGVNTQVVQLRSQLENARLNLEWTSVRAPADGTVINSFLVPGQRVANLPMRSWMAYLDRSRVRIGVVVPQYTIRNVRPGQPAEIVLKLWPGECFSAKVDTVIPLNAGGQIQAGGVLPDLNIGADASGYAVILELDDGQLQLDQLPGGAAGTAAIYTNRAQAAHVIRKVMLRMQSWMNYILP